MSVRMSAGFVVMLACSAVSVGADAVAADRKIKPAPRPDVRISYNRGMTQLRSERPHSTVVVEMLDPIASAQNRALLTISVENRTGAPTNITTDTVTAADQRGRPMEVLTADRLRETGQKVINRQATWRRVGVALSAASAGQGSAQINSSGSVYGPGGFASYNGTTTATYTDPVAERMARDQAAGQMADIASNASTQSASLAEFAAVAGMLSQTVQNGDTYRTGSSVQLARDTIAFDLKVWVGDEAHWFTFQTAK